MLDEIEYSEGVVPGPTWALGLRLNPLTIGHLLLLRAQRSPFLGYKDYPISYGKLRTAALVMSHDFDGAQSALASPVLRLFLRVWHWRLSLFGLRGVHIQREATRILDHIWSAYRFRPIFLPNSESSGPSEMESPVEWILLVHLMQKLNMSFHEAVNCPWSRAFWLHGTAAEMTGLGGLATMDGLREAKKRADEAHERIAEAIKSGMIQRGGK